MSNLKSITVLMTGAGAPGAFGIIKCLKNNGERDVRIVGVDMNPAAGCRDLVDAFYVVPAASEDSFIDEVYSVAVKESVDVVVPIVTKELLKFSCAKSQFAEAGIKVCVLEPEQLDVVNDKAALLEFCRDNGLPTPSFKVALTAEQVEEALEDLGCADRPVYVKSALGNGSRGVRYVDPTCSKYDRFFNQKPDSAMMSKKEIMDALKERDEIPKMIVMEALPGVEYSADVIGDHGKVAYLAIRKSPVVRSSITLESTIVDDPHIRELCAAVVERLCLHGNVGFDFRENAAGIPRLMEINPRLTATVVLNAAAGINFPYLGVKQALGEDLPDGRLRCGVSVHRRYEERYTDENGDPIDPFALTAS